MFPIVIFGRCMSDVPGVLSAVCTDTYGLGHCLNKGPSTVKNAHRARPFSICHKIAGLLSLILVDELPVE